MSTTFLILRFVELILLGCIFAAIRRVAANQVATAKWIQSAYNEFRKNRPRA